MQVFNLTPGGYASNCYLASEGASAVLIDATVSPARLRTLLEDLNTRLEAILLTHGHFDHILTVKSLANDFDAPIYIHRADEELLADGEKNASAAFGESKVFSLSPALLDGNESLSFGELSFRVLHTPGHTEGSVTYLCGDLAFTGDTLFRDGYGRTDLYGGSFHKLRHSLNILRNLPVTAHIYPGHGEDACITEIFRSKHA